jgi:hypothetical protein
VAVETIASFELMIEGDKYKTYVSFKQHITCSCEIWGGGLTTLGGRSLDCWHMIHGTPTFCLLAISAHQWMYLVADCWSGKPL